jgi:hypothetical protein
LQAGELYFNCFYDGIFITMFQISKTAAECNEHARAHFCFEIGAESPEQLIFIDESCIDIRITYRIYGWAPTGERARMSARFQHGRG